MKSFRCTACDASIYKFLITFQREKSARKKWKHTSVKEMRLWRMFEFETKLATSKIAWSFVSRQYKLSSIMDRFLLLFVFAFFFLFQCISAASVTGGDFRFSWQPILQAFVCTPPIKSWEPSSVFAQLYYKIYCTVHSQRTKNDLIVPLVCIGNHFFKSFSELQHTHAMCADSEVQTIPMSYLLVCAQLFLFSAEK